jgi:hypothetical protein
VVWEPNAIEAGLIATVVTLLGILITNQSKVSEFRQKWIDALRDDAATLITHTYFIRGAEIRAKVRSEPKADLNESYIQISQVSARIRLRLNPEEKETEAIIKAMDKIQNANQDADGLIAVIKHVDEFSAATQVVLKKEWKRVKYGEPLYRTVLILVILSVLFFFITVLRQHPLAQLMGRS